MHEALMVLSNNQFQKVTADRVQHQDFKRIFQCPECHATLTFRRSYTRNGHHVPAAFVHPRDGKPCEERVEYNFSSTKQLSPFELINRGQNTQKLEKAFLRCQKYFAIGTQKSSKIPSMLDGWYNTAAGKSSRGDYRCGIFDLTIFDDPFTEDWIITDSNLKKKIEYNKINGAIHDNPDFLIEAVSKVFSSRRLDIHFNQEVHKVKNSILSDPQRFNFFEKKRESDWWKEFYENIYGKTLDSLSVEDLVDEHIAHLNGLLRYLRQGISLEAKKKFFEVLILGSLDFPVTRDIVWTQEQRNSYESSVLVGLCIQEADDLAKKNGIDKKAIFLDYPIHIIAEARRNARLNYERIFESILLEHRSSVLKKREGMIESFSLMSKDFLESIMTDQHLKDAISDFDRGKRSLGSRFIRFFVSRQVSFMKRYDWSILPLFYEDIRFLYLDFFQPSKTSKESSKAD